MKRSKIEKVLHAGGAVLGDRLLVTERFAKGRTGQRYYTLNQVGNHTLHLSDGGKNYILRYNEIAGIEMADPNPAEWISSASVCESCGQDKPHVEPYRIDSRPDGVMLCDECFEGCMTEGNEFIPFEKGEAR